jgi:ATP-binding cassette, subfamily B, bacterial PglK
MTSTTKQSIVRKIWSLLTSAERHSAVMLLGLMFMGMTLETIGVGLVIPAIGLLTQSEFLREYPAFQSVFRALGNPDQQNLVMVGMMVLVGVFLIKTFFLALLVWMQTRFAYAVGVRVSQHLFAIYLYQPYAFHLQRNSAHLIRNVMNEVTLLVFHAIIPGMLLLSESLVLLGLCSLLLFVEPLGTLIVASILGAAAWGFHTLTRVRIARWGDARQYHDGQRIQHLQQGLGAVKDVMLLGRGAEFLEQYHLHNVQSARAGQMRDTLQQLPRLWLELLAVSGLAMLVFMMMVQGRTLESVLPAVGLFAAAAFRLMPSVNRLLGALQSLRYGLPVIEILHNELALDATRTSDIHGRTTPFKCVLELNQVIYNYPGAKAPVVKGVSLAIRRGEMIGFIGSSGAGKSTLIDILLGLLLPNAGEVRVDGKNIQANLRGWQDQVGYVPQSVFLTDDTLRRNVAFGLPNEQIDDAAVLRAIKTAQLEEFVVRQPDGLATLMGERGVRLSGGQRQRIGIARALYHDPAVLVLDEATSSLDGTTEHELMQSVCALQGRKTIIVVAHRFSAVEHCHRLYQLHEGRIVWEGPPDIMAFNAPDSAHVPA